MKLRNALPSLDDAADAATPQVWHVLLQRAGYVSHGPKYLHPQRPGYVKLARARGRPNRVISFDNGPEGAGRPLDAPTFCTAHLHTTWDEAVRLIFALREDTASRTGQSGGGVGDSPPAPRSGPVPPEVESVARRMGDVGIPIDIHQLNQGIARLQQHVALGDRTAASGLDRLRQLRARIGPDGRARVNWIPGRAISGRWGVEPGILDLSKDLRHIVRAPPGRVLIEADVVAAELIAVAALSGHPILREIALTQDPYGTLAGRLGLEAPNGLTEDARSMIKHFFLVSVNGGGPAAQQQVLSSLDRATNINTRIAWNRTFAPGLAEWRKRLEAHAGAQLPVSLVAYPRSVDLTGGSPNQLTAWLSQALVAAHVDDSIVRLTSMLQRAAPIIQVHDAVIVESDLAYANEARAVIHHTLSRPLAVGDWPFQFHARLSTRSTWAHDVR